jgi:hypothetical protein
VKRVLRLEINWNRTLGVCAESNECLANMVGNEELRVGPYLIVWRAPRPDRRDTEGYGSVYVYEVDAVSAVAGA